MVESGIAGFSSRAEKVEHSVIRKSGLFDSKYYCDKYKDLGNYRFFPLRHFVKYGWKNGRNPSKNFEIEYYYLEHPGLRESGLNPLFHYIIFNEKRDSRNLKIKADVVEKQRKNLFISPVPFAKQPSKPRARLSFR